MTTAVRPLPLTISEAAFQRTVIELAVLHRWRVCHFRPARTAHGWRTPVEGSPGLPDLVMARDGVVLLAELKRHRGRVSPDQAAWLRVLGGHGRLWTPMDWPEIVEELKPAAQRVHDSGTV
jgi:hypothetical protein